MNQVTLLGRLTKDPELKYSQSADPVAVCRTGIAVRRGFSKQGEPDADFFNLVAFKKNAEFLNTYFRKGQLIAIVGRLQTRSWEDQGGVKHNTIEIVVQEAHFAESKKDQQAPGNEISEAFKINLIEDEDDLPF